MASLQERNGSYRVQFFFRGKLHGFTIGKVTRAEADAKAAQVDYLLMRLKQKLVAIPDGTDIVTFVEHDGRPPGLAAPPAGTPRQVIILGRLRDRYIDTHSNGTLEANSLATCKLHLSHFCRVLGAGLPVPELTLAALQGYMNTRSANKVAVATVRKEMATLRAAWNWGGPMGLTTGAFPSRGLRYPKADEKPPFMTLAEVRRQLDAGGDPDALWESLYLTAAEVREMLAHVPGRRGGALQLSPSPTTSPRRHTTPTRRSGVPRSPTRAVLGRHRGGGEPLLRRCRVCPSLPPWSA